MAFFSFLAAAFLFLLAVFHVADVFTLSTVNLGLFFLALGFVIGGSGAVVARLRVP